MMFRYLNKIIRRNPLRTAIVKGRTGQVAVILILVVAAALIFYAVSLNLGRLSGTKAATTIAADTSAATLASYIASTGQSIFKTTLGGQKRKCGSTSVVVAIVALVIAVIMIWVAPMLAAWAANAVIAGSGAAAAATASTTALVGAGLAAANLALQVAVIQPGLSSLWNDQIWRVMAREDATLESGIQKALTGIATDGVLVDDVWDSDGDRVFGYDANGVPLDKIGRFGLYYDKQRIGAIKPPKEDEIRKFQIALRDFLLEDTDDWGIYDDKGPICNTAECDPCCVPPEVRSPDIACNPNEAGLQADCNSPYGTDYPWVYDAYRGNPDPAFVSFQEQLGRDDEHQLFEKNPVDPNGRQISRDPQCVAGCLGVSACEDACPPATPPPLLRSDCVALCGGDPACEARCPPYFKLKDTTGFYAADNRKGMCEDFCAPGCSDCNPGSAETYYPLGIFPFFYKIADWKVNLDTAADPFDLVKKPHQCHWCDKDDPTAGAVGPCPANQPAEIPQLILPEDAPNVDGVSTPGGAKYNIKYCVDGPNPPTAPGFPPLAVDLVRLPDGKLDRGKIVADDDQCAQKAIEGDPSVPDPPMFKIGFWKRGGDLFCSDTATPPAWPYSSECKKYGTTCTVDDGTGTGTTVNVGCACGEDPGDPNNAPQNWPDDLADDVLYGLNGFIDWAKGILNKTPGDLEKSFRTWYPEAAGWIEPGAGPCPWPGSCATSNPEACDPWCSYLRNPEDGALWVWYKKIKEMRSRLEAWRRTSFARSGACLLVWCIPDPAGCPGVPAPPAPEAATFDSNPDLKCIAACVENPDPAASAACRAACPRAGNGIYGDMDDIAACVDWNASDKLTYTDTTTATGNAKKFKACVDACGAPGLPLAIEKCSDLPRSLVPFVDTRLPSPDPAVVCAPGGWIEGIKKSIPEAENQVVKFTARYNFLLGRLIELDRIISVLRDAEDKFFGFLGCPNGAACKLIKARMNFDSAEHGLPEQAIYGWQSEAEKGQPPDSGKWHIVRVDARLPSRCDSACNVDQAPAGDPAGGDPAWPWVKTSTNKKGLSTKRCYWLESTEGIVKTRVTRFDEAGTSAAILFPNAVEIWKPTFARSDRAPTGDPATIKDVCKQNMLSDDPEGEPSPPPAHQGSRYYGAFLLNERRPDNSQCWDLANQLLSRGVTSEACARYYFHEGGGGLGSGMEFRFVPCKNF